jgi:vancomycin resistance protein YoaR
MRIKPIIRTILTLSLFCILIPASHAMEIPNKITLKTDFKIWDVYPKKMDWFSDYNKTFFGKLESKALEEDLEIIDKYIRKKSIEGINLAEIRKYLESKISPHIYREAEDVIIDMDDEGNITFEGNGFYGRRLDTEKAIMMLKHALENNISYINLPLVRQDPKVTILNKELRKMGIKELYSAGETYFKGSPANRINNISVGLSKFNGHIIKPNEEFVFGNVLGEVDETTGYKEELVIKGDRTVPEYGGGLCQVSTTAYRAALSGGLKVTDRRNHSYSVSYYSPTGLDATVYPPSVDLRFINDSPSHILIHSFRIGTSAYYNFYGTKDDREVYMIGPYYFNRIEPPEKRIEYSDKLEPGEIMEVGHAVPGISSSWYRQVVYDKKINENKSSILDHIFSKYEARPDFEIIGKEQPTFNFELSNLENGY